MVKLLVQIILMEILPREEVTKNLPLSFNIYTFDWVMHVCE